MTYDEFLSPLASIIDTIKAQQWADLGCGSGVFTHALANLLPSSSHIFAIDKNFQQLPNIMGNNVSIEFLKADFNSTDFSFSKLDGILMANSLHYIKDKKTLIQKLDSYLKPDKSLLIIEYDTTISNQWVPYPINFLNLEKLVKQIGNRNINKIAERKSIYGQGNMYAAFINSAT